MFSLEKVKSISSARYTSAGFPRLFRPGEKREANFTEARVVSSIPARDRVAMASFDWTEKRGYERYGVAARGQLGLTETGIDIRRRMLLYTSNTSFILRSISVSRLLRSFRVYPALFFLPPPRRPLVLRDTTCATLPALDSSIFPLRTLAGVGYRESRRDFSRCTKHRRQINPTSFATVFAGFV